MFFYISDYSPAFHTVLTVRINWPWWQSGLSHHSNSSRVAAEDPGPNPKWDFIHVVQRPLVLKAPLLDV